MLLPDMLLHFIMLERGLKQLPSINKISVRNKRSWKNRTPEQKAAFSAMRSRVQKETFKKHPHLRKVRSKSFKKATKKYWATVDEQKKEEHIKKMSDGMKTAWGEGGDDFGPRIANEQNVIKLNGNVIIEKDVPRINDYCGVLTESDFSSLQQL